MTIKQVEFEGSILTIDDEAKLQPEDMYLAERNTGPKLLTCREVDTWNGVVIPVDFPAYSFNIFECRKVIQIDDSKV